MSNSRSTGGPKTATGREKVSKNAISHGLRARKWLSSDEKADLEKLMDALLAEHNPQTATEELMVERIAIGMTKLRRLQSVEDAMYAKARAEATDLTRSRAGILNLQMLEEAAMPPIKVLDTLARYQTSLDRQISRTIGELIVIIQNRDQTRDPTERNLSVMQVQQN